MLMLRWDDGDDEERNVERSTITRGVRERERIGERIDIELFGLLSSHHTIIQPNNILVGPHHQIVINTSQSPAFFYSILYRGGGDSSTYVGGCSSVVLVYFSYWWGWWWHSQECDLHGVLYKFNPISFANPFSVSSRTISFPHSSFFSSSSLRARLSAAFLYVWER